jgi:hypothetical protein
MKKEQINYTAQGEILNIPEEILLGAGLPQGSELSVLLSDGMLIIAGAHNTERLQSLTDELSCVMEELGYDPDEIYSAVSLEVAEFEDCGDDE